MPTERLPLDLRRLKTLRLRVALSQRDLAKLAGVNESTYRAIELGQHGAHPLTARKLAKALGVRPQDLMQPEQGAA